MSVFRIDHTPRKILKTNIMDKLSTDEMQVIKGGGVWVEINGEWIWIASIKASEEDPIDSPK